MAKKRRRRKLKKSVKFILGLILLFLIFIFIYLIYSNTSKYLFFKGIEKSSNELIDLYNEFKDQYMPYSNDYYYNNTNTLLDIETNELKDSFVFKGDIYLDKESYYYDLDINVNDSNNYNLDLYTKDNRLYYSIDNSKYYYDNEDVSINNNYNYDDLFKVFINAIKSNVSNSDFDKTKEDIGINSKEYSTKKVSLIINNDLYNLVMKEFYKNVKKSDTLIDSLYNLSSYETKELLISYMDSFIEKGTTEEINLEYSIYYNNSKPIKHHIIGNDYELSYVSVSDFVELSYSNSESTSSFKYSNDSINIYLGNMGNISCSLDESKIGCDFVDMDKVSLGNLDYSISGDNNYSTKLSLVLDLELIHIEVESENKIEVNKSIPKIDISNSKSSENMSEDEKKTLDELMYFFNDIIAF